MNQNKAHRELADRCTRGDREAQAEIYELYYKAMYNSALRILNDAYAAEDIMHEAFISAFSNAHAYRGEVSLGAWLKRITVNKSINELKRQRRALTLVSELQDDHVDEMAGDAAPPQWTPAQVYQAMQALPDGYRVIVSLFLIEGYDHEEISRIMGISASTSRSQYTRGRKKLQVLLTNRKQNGRI